MACSTLQKDKRLERPDRWKRHFLKTNGMLYFAKRQEPRAPRKMETLLSEDQWRVLLCRTTGRQRARPRKMETRFSEDQWHVLLCKKTPLSIGDQGARLVSTFQNDRSPRRNAHFRLSNRTSDFWSEGVFVRSPTRKHHFRFVTPLGPFIIFKSVDSKSRFPKSWAPMGKPRKQHCTGAPFPNGWPDGWCPKLNM